MAQAALVCLLLLSMVLAASGVVPTFTGCRADIDDVSVGSIDYSFSSVEKPIKEKPSGRQRERSIVKCQWKISVDQGQRLSLSFQRLELNHGDNLIIKNGKQGSIVRYDKNNSSKPFSTTGNKMYIQLSTDKKITKSGFKLTWEILNQEKANKKAASSVKFSIRHKISGKFLKVGKQDNEDILKFFNAWDSTSVFTFEEQDAEWGYIRHNNKLLSSKEGMSPPDEGNLIILTHDARPWALFAIDQVNNHIVSRIGWPMEPHNQESDRRFYPKDMDWVALKPRKDDSIQMLPSEFEIVDPCGNCGSGHEEIPNIYGNATIIGDWHLIYSVINPKAEHTYEVQVTVGRSESRSTNTTFQLRWEIGFTAQYWFASMSTSMELSYEIQQSSSLTWTEKTKRTSSIKVFPGKTVAVWQKDYIGEQYGHRQVHGSTMVADTDNPLKRPDDDTPFRFI